MVVAPVSGAPYSEDHELRRRQRYAIVAGLERQGFVPRDPEHLGFFWPRVIGKSPNRTSEVVSFERMPEVVPFEWFDKNNNPLLLLWFDEDVLNGSPSFPLKGFDEFFCRTLRTGVPSSFRWGKALVLGPGSSTTLNAMAKELDGKWRSDRCSDEERAEFYVFSATAADTELMPEQQFPGPDCPGTRDHLSEVFFKRGVKLYRMTATDAALACLMRDELALRQPHRISAVSANIFDQLSPLRERGDSGIPQSCAGFRR